MATVSWGLLAQGIMKGGTSHFWFVDGLTPGTVVVLAATKDLERSYGQSEHAFRIADQWYLTKQDGTLQLNFEVAALPGQSMGTYQVHWARIGS
jgi:hypothetical protein